MLQITGTGELSRLQCAPIQACYTTLSVDLYTTYSSFPDINASRHSFCQIANFCRSLLNIRVSEHSVQRHPHPNLGSWRVHKSTSSCTQHRTLRCWPRDRPPYPRRTSRPPRQGLRNHNSCRSTRHPRCQSRIQNRESTTPHGPLLGLHCLYDWLFLFPSSLFFRTLLNFVFDIGLSILSVDFHLHSKWIATLLSVRSPLASDSGVI